MSPIVRFARSTFSSLSGRNFRLYFIGQAVSMTGGWVQSVAQSWLVLNLTNSGAALGLVSALQFAPSLFLGPYVGVVCDRVPKRRLLVLTQTALGLVALWLGVMVALGAARPWVVYVAAGVLGLLNAVDYPTRQAFLFELTGPDQVVSAVGLNATIANVARIVGPALAAALITLGGMAAGFFVNAATFLVVILCLALVRTSELHCVRRESEGGLAEGLAYSARTPVVRESILMMAIIGVLVFEFSVTLPMLSKFTFAGGASGLGYLMSAMGVGAVIGGLITAGRRGDGLRRLALAALGFGVFTAITGLMPSLPLAAASMALVGLCSARFTGLSNSLLQLKSAPAMRSRVIALWSSAFMGSTFIGAPLLGWMGEQFGARSPMVVGGLVGGLLAAGIGIAGLRREHAEPAQLAAPRTAEERAA